MCYRKIWISIALLFSLSTFSLGLMAKSFKGMELYVWGSPAGLHYSLLDGTNRLKYASEILAHEKKFDEILDQLELKENEVLSISHSAIQNADKPLVFSSMSKEDMKKLVDLCKKNNITLYPHT